MIGSAHAIAQTDVLTANHDRFRTNANLRESVLKPSSVLPGRFGKIGAYPVDGQVYAQPLVVTGVEIPGKGMKDVLIVATMHNSVYAFDANPRAGDRLLWRANLGPPVPAAHYSIGGYFYHDILPLNGILSTPVIDGETLRLYAVTADYRDASYAYTLHVLDLRTGQPAADSGVRIRADVEGGESIEGRGTVDFDAFWHLQRPGLLLSMGRLYVAFGSHGGTGPHHGWIMAFDAADVRTQTGVFNTSPDGRAASVWMSGRGLAADEDGSIYAITGNGPFDGTRNFGETVLKLGRDLDLISSFTPAEYESLSEADNDFGACGAVLIPGTRLLLAGGKVGKLHLLSTDQLGGLQIGDAGARQIFQAVAANIYTMAVWKREQDWRIYVQGAWEPVQAHTLAEGKLAAEPVTRALDGGGIPYYGMTLSAHGGDTASGVLWVTSTQEGYEGRAFNGILRAYDAEDLRVEVWNSEMSLQDRLPSFAKFAAPTVANGYVYVATFSNQVVAYGLKEDNEELARELTVLNAFSRSGGNLSPGGLVELRAEAAGPDNPIVAAEDQPLPQEMGGVRALFNGEPGGLLEVARDRVVAMIPYSLAGSDLASVQIYSGDGEWSISSLPVAEADPALKTADGSGTGPGAFVHEDGQPNAAGHPARRGTLVRIPVTGFGPLTQDNQAALKFSVTVSGVAAEVQGCAIGSNGPRGACELSFRVPEGSDRGTRVPVVVRAGQFTAPAVTLSVQ